MRLSSRALLGLSAGFAIVAAACGDGQDDAIEEAATADRPVVVVTTSILGDVVENLSGGQFEVVTIMPAGADPHDFQASAQQVAQIGEADVLVTNGAAFEEGLLDVIESAEADGVPTFEAISAVSSVDFGEHGHADEEHADEEHGDEEHGDEEHGDEEHGDEEHGDEEHGDEEEHADEKHAHSGVDPHFFTDPARMAVAANAIADFLIANVDGVDAEAVTSSASAYIAELEALDASIEDVLADIPAEGRVLVTNHEVFGYFADRYGFEVVGTVVPGGTTIDGTSAEELTELVDVIEREGVRAIFADTSSSTELAATLAEEVGDVAVVELFSESLGPDDSEGATYIGMVRTNAERIAAALAG